MAISFSESRRSWQSQLRALLFGSLVTVALLQPGIALGGALTWAYRHWRKAPLRRLLILSCFLSAFVAINAEAISLAWPWRLWAEASGVHSLLPSAFVLPRADVQTIWQTLIVELFAGPSWFMGMLFWRWTMKGMPSSLVQEQRKRQAERRRRLGLAPDDAKTKPVSGTQFRLGTDLQSSRVIDLTLPFDLAQHTTVLGKMGSGKTTTAAKLVEGALSVDWPVLIVDAKGLGALRRFAEGVAARHGLPFRLVAPDDAASYRYNPCTGTPSQISNKLIGAFSFGPEAEIYKNIAQEVLPVLARALAEAGKPVTVHALFRLLSKEGMAGITRQLPAEAQALRADLLDLAGRALPYPSAFAGMRGRLGALLQGNYGQLLCPPAGSDGQVLNLGQAFAPGAGVTYISLPALEASEDVELMARVLAQDIKQIAAARLAAGERHYALCLLDEFAGLREASQLNDLLLQAREARIACVISTQFLPNLNDAPALRQALLSAGFFIAHQVSPKDAEIVAALFGTDKAQRVTRQIDYETGTSEKGSIREVDEYRVHPNELRELTRGTAAMRIEPGRRRIAIVRVDLPEEMTENGNA